MPYQNKSEDNEDHVELFSDLQLSAAILFHGLCATLFCASVFYLISCVLILNLRNSELYCSRITQIYRRFKNVNTANNIFVKRIKTTAHWYFYQQNCLLTRQHEPIMIHSAIRGVEQDVQSKAHKDSDAYYNLHYLWVVEIKCHTVISEDNDKYLAEKYSSLDQLSINTSLKSV